MIEKKYMIKNYVFLHLLLLFYSAGGILSKIAGNYEVWSIEFVALYIIKMVTLFIYAILWKQILKHFDLTTAFANKAVTVIWGLVFGVCFFGETITLQKVIGSIVIMIGIWVAVREDG